MNENKLREYAKLIVKIGANVQKGQRVRLQAGVDQIPLVKMVAEECYKAGASYVEMFWECGEINKLHYQYAAADVLGEVPVWEEERAKQMTVDLPVRIFIDSSDPDELAGISPDLISTVSQMRQKVMKKYRDQIDGKHQWLIVAAASGKWAKKVFPDDTEDVAVEKLWDAIFDCVYLKDGEDAEKIWQAHNERMTQKANWLNEQNFKTLHYTSSNGTDFRVDLIPGAKWGSAGDINHLNRAFFVPNMPTEEVFTSPMKGKCEGRLVSTKPLSRSGQVIDHFTVDFKDGRVVDCHAEQGEEVLKKMFAMDEGASMLGEVALVPKESPINQSGLMFYNTLFDENACCHVAAGRGFSEVIEGFMDMTDEEIYAKGINDSMIHMDFMVGSDDLHIVGIREDGSEVDIFVDGEPGLSKAEVIHCLVRGRRTPENRPRCLLQHGQGNFKLAANFGYSSRGSADPRESLRKRRILKLALNAHTVLLQTARSVFRLGAG